MSALVTWIGHASALLSFGEQRVLIDPLGRRRCQALPAYQAILITHAHVDHLNRWTLAALERDVTLVVPKGAKSVVADLGFREVREADVGDQFSIGNLDVECVPTKHDRGRWRRGDSTVCVGYVCSQRGIAIHHAGDVDMSDFETFEQLGKRIELDATLLPIGGMLPVWYYRMRRNALDRGIHIDPDTAIDVAKRLGAKHMIPVHWGTVNLRLGPSHAPRLRLETVAQKNQQTDLVRVLAHGQSLTLGKDTP